VVLVFESNTNLLVLRLLLYASLVQRISSLRSSVQLRQELDEMGTFVPGGDPPLYRDNRYIDTNSTRSHGEHRDTVWCHKVSRHSNKYIFSELCHSCGADDHYARPSHGRYLPQQLRTPRSNSRKTFLLIDLRTKPPISNRAIYT
jgi:hypothetical protein